MSNKIKFIPATKRVELLVPPPKPTKSYIPDWFKNIAGVNEKNMEINEMGNPNSNVKNCIPFLDILTAGYIQETWTDIHIESDEDGHVIYNQSSIVAPEIMSSRNRVDLPVEKYYYNFEFTWSQVWMPKLESGYSCLILSPINRPELPFYTASAIVDSDKMNYAYGGNLPFYIKKGFTGLIPAGTPMYQIIPFKRESWKMQVEKFDDEKAMIGANELRKNFIGSYKKRLWSKKEFN
jgi:hypothetical protein